MSSNAYRRLMSLLPEKPADVGEVIGVGTDGVTVELLTGARQTVRGTATLGALVYVRNGVIEGPAPELDTVEIGV